VCTYKAVLLSLKERRKFFTEDNVDKPWRQYRGSSHARHSKANTARFYFTRYLKQSRS
jgi:hypothetical protein